MRRTPLLAAATLLAITGAAIAGEGAVYVAGDDDGTAALWLLDRDDASATRIGSTGFEYVAAMDFDSGGRLLAIARRASDGREILAEIDTGTGAGTEITPIFGASGVSGMTIFHGSWWLCDAAGDFFLLEPWGATTPVDARATGFGPGAQSGGIAYVQRGPGEGPSRVHYAVDGELAELDLTPYGYYLRVSVRPLFGVRSAYAMDFDPTTGLIHAVVSGFGGASYVMFEPDPASLHVRRVGYTRVYTALAVIPNRPPVIVDGPLASATHVSFADRTVDFSIVVDDPDGSPVTCQWDFADGGSATGLAVTHTFATVGRHRVTATISDGEYETSAWTLVWVNSPPAIDALGVTPRGGAAQEELQFSVSASDPNGSSLDIRWDFGDGSTATGNSPRHAYAQDGAYSATVTVDDGRDTVVRTLRVPVGQVVSRPRLRGWLNFRRPGRDRAFFACAMDLPKGFERADATVDVEIVGVTRSFVLDRSGRYRDPTAAVWLRYRKRTGWRLTVRLRRSDFRAAWADQGLSETGQRNTEVGLTTVILVDGTTCFAATDHHYTVRSGKWGRLKARK